MTGANGGPVQTTRSTRRRAAASQADGTRAVAAPTPSRIGRGAVSRTDPDMVS